MKNKAIYFSAVCLCLVAAYFSSVKISSSGNWVHQHKQFTGELSKEGNDTEFSTHLPIVSINTNGRSIPGESREKTTITSEFLIYDQRQAENNVQRQKENNVQRQPENNVQRQTENNAQRQTENNAQGQTENNVQRQTQNNTQKQSKNNVKKQKKNKLTNTPTFSSTANIRYRGNSSLHFDKKSYKVELVKEDGKKREESLLDMPDHDEWILNGPYLDKTLMRNYMCLNISAEIMGYAPRVRYCELFVNEEYKGVYLLMENVSFGVGRVNLNATKKRDQVTSYIIRADRGDEESNELNNFTKYAKRMPTDVDKLRYVLNVEYPPKSLLNPTKKENIEKDFSKFEKSLYSFDYNDEIYGYESFINTASFIDYFIINEFFQNYDAVIYSTYFNKDIREKLSIGPVWDFNNACDNYVETAYDGTGFVLHDRTWYSMLIKDEEFNKKVRARYKELRKTVLSESYLMEYIDEVELFLGDAIDRNFEVWGYSFDPEQLDDYSLLLPAQRNITSYEEAVEQLKSFLRIRGNWMDKNIDNLQQYSHPSKTKKYNH